MMNKKEKKNRLPVFTERFLQLRKNMTQAEFAEFAGITRPTVGFYESGSRIPDALVLSKITKACGVSADWLIGNTDVKNPDADLRAVCDYTGLSENVVIALRDWKDQKNKHSQVDGFYHFVDYVFSNDEAKKILYDVLSEIDSATYYRCMEKVSQRDTPKAMTSESLIKLSVLLQQRGYVIARTNQVVDRCIASAGGKMRRLLTHFVHDTTKDIEYILDDEGSHFFADGMINGLINAIDAEMKSDLENKGIGDNGID